jgi:putative flippase GtrA
MVRALVERGTRYSLVGVVCVLLNYAIIVATNGAGLHYMLAMLIAFAVVTPVGFLLHSRFTFHERLRWQAFWRFCAGAASAAPLAFAAMILLCSGLKLHVAVATPIATLIVFLWNFVAAHWAIVPQFKFRSAFMGAEE